VNFQNENKTKKIKMKLLVHYSDTTADTLEKTIKLKKKDWESYYLALKTDTDPDGMVVIGQRLARPPGIEPPANRALAPQGRTETSRG